MIKKKLLPLAVLASSMLLPSIASAEIPGNTVLLGTKAYDINLLNDGSYTTELQQAALGAKNVVLWKTIGGKILNAGTNAEVDPSTLPAQFTYKNKDGQVSTIDNDQVQTDLKVDSVSAITTTKLQVELSAAVDSAVSANFQIPGITITGATLDATKKIVTLTVTGAETGKDYTLTATGLKINAVTMDDATKDFTMPDLGELYNYTVKMADAAIKADGASQSLATFQIEDKEGNVVTDAQDVEVAFNTTFGTFGEQRVAVQDGVATNMLTSEFLEVDRTAQITATIVEAADASLIGKKAETSILMSPNPGAADENFGASMTAAEADQADRVIAYFNKDVKVSDYDDNADGVLENAAVTVRKDSTSSITGSACDIKGLLPVAGNTKALQILLDVETNAANALTDNSDVFVEFTDNTGTLAVTKSATFKLTDARKPAMLSVVNEGLKTLKVTFSEALDDTSANDENNWTIDGTPLTNTTVWGVGAKAKVGEFDPTTGTDLRNVVTITLGTGKYFASGDHSIQAARIGDWALLSDANNIMNTQTLDFNIPADDEVPTATVEVQSPEQWLITYNKDVAETAAAYAGKLTLEKYNTTTSTWETDARVTSVVTAAVNDTNLNLVVTKLDDNKFLVQTDYDWTRVYDTINSKKNYFNDQFRLKIAKDAVTNVANGKKSVEQTLTLGDAMTKADITSPVISEIKEITPGAVYQATMSEPVKLSTAANAEGATASQAQGSNGAAGTWTNIPVATAEFIKSDLTKTIPATIGAAFVDDYNKVLTITPTAALDAGDWTLVIRSISDDVGNTAASATKDLTVVGAPPAASDFKVLWAFADTDTDKVVEDVDAADGDGTYDYIYVKFTKPVAITGDYKNALKTSNYTLDGVALPTGTQILSNIEGYDDLDGVTDSITIKLPDGALQDKNAPHVLNISGLIESTTAGETLSNPGEKTLAYDINGDWVADMATDIADEMDAYALVSATSAAYDDLADGIAAGEIDAFETAYNAAAADIATLDDASLVKAQYQAAIDSYLAQAKKLDDFAAYMVPGNFDVSLAASGTPNVGLVIDGGAEIATFDGTLADGSDRFTIKVADTDTYGTLVTLDPATGVVALPAGTDKDDLGNAYTQTITITDKFWGVSDTVTVEITTAAGADTLIVQAD